MIASDKSSWGHNYCKYYEQWFAPIKGEGITLLELGIGGEDAHLGGASLIGWINYFENGIIGGIDIYDKKELEDYSDRLFTYQGSQDDPIFLNEVIKDLGTPDIIIDDASHISSLTIKSFEILFPLLKSGGLYFIEDLSCSYRNGFEGSKELKSLTEPTVVNYLFEMVHSLHNPQYGVSGYTQPFKWNQVESVHFYPELVLIKKK